MNVKRICDLPGGYKMPAIGLGTFLANDEADLELAIHTAIDAGYRHFDTAWFYNNEYIISTVLNRWYNWGKLKREDIFLTTKLPPNGLQENLVETFLKKSLINLQVDYVDLYIIHFPVCFSTDKQDLTSILNNDRIETELTDHIAVWKKLEELVDAGKIKSIGLSNFNKSQIERILKVARIKPACLQIELHVYLQQRELVTFCQENGIVVTAFSPLGAPGYNSFLISCGKEPKKLPDALHDSTVLSIAKKHKKTAAQVLIRYLLQKDVCVIPKSITPARIYENIDVFDFILDSNDMKALDDLEVGESARIVDWTTVKGISDNPEWPFGHKFKI